MLEELPDGTRVGRYVLLRDVDGQRHALSRTAIHAASEGEDGDTVLFLPGGKALRVGAPLAIVLDWLEGTG